MKLELKHLAGYLPYELGLVARNVVSETPRRIYGKLSAMNIMSLVEGDSLYKPILRPLSDLTKEIEVDGEKFVPIEWLNKNKSVDLIEVQDLSGKKSIFNGRTTNIRFFEYCIIEKLYEWHFAVNIPEHLYIDINTI